MAGTWTPEGNVASTNVTKNSLLVTYSTKSLGGEKNQSIEALSIGGNLEATSNADWITNINIQTNTHDSTAKYYDIKFNVSANPTTTARTGAITFTYNNATATLNVTQERGDSPTSYTLYVYDPSNLNAHFSYYRVNGGTVLEIPTGKTILIYTYSASTESNTINVELLPKSTSIASKFGFVTNTTSPDNNIVKYTNPTVDQLFTTQGFTALSYNSDLGFGYATTNNDNTIWGETVINDSSTFIKLAHMSPYPPINIYLSNKLNQQKVVNVFSLYMMNDEEYGGGLKLGEFCSFNNIPFPNSQLGDIEIKNNISSNGITIPLNVNINSETKEYIRLQFEGDREITGKFIFKAKTALGLLVVLNITLDDALFALAFQSTIMTLDLNSRAGNNGEISCNFIDESTTLSTDLVNYTNQGDISYTDHIDLKLPLGYIFNLNSGTYTEDHVKLYINLSVNISS